MFFCFTQKSIHPSRAQKNKFCTLAIIHSIFKMFPASWEGDVDPSHVNITQCWKAGAALAASALTNDGRFDANELNYDLIGVLSLPPLCPL